jgi:glycosyltransferase involved in cell wall biosynthesis
MLSICIPVYNYSVVELVKILDLQAEKSGKPIEILVIDDASAINYHLENEKIEKLSHVKYIRLPKNIGRSKIRNLLAEKSANNFLLFLDANIKIDNDLFVENYLKIIVDEKVIIGGIKSCEKPVNKEYILRWKYSNIRESQPSAIRQLNPYKNFIAKNFLIPKSVFKNIQFDQDITGYGHEDTLFGLKLKQLIVPIIHIDNAVIHANLENNKRFISKTEEGIANLLSLYSSRKNDIEFIKSFKLLKYYLKLGKLNKQFVAFVFKLFKPVLIWQLTGFYPKMLVFDFYKIGYMCSLIQNK